MDTILWKCLSISINSHTLYPPSLITIPGARRLASSNARHNATCALEDGDHGRWGSDGAKNAQKLGMEISGGKIIKETSASNQALDIDRGMMGKCSGYCEGETGWLLWYEWIGVRRSWKICWRNRREQAFLHPQKPNWHGHWIIIKPGCWWICPGKMWLRKLLWRYLRHDLCRGGGRSTISTISTSQDLEHKTLGDVWW